MSVLLDLDDGKSKKSKKKKKSHRTGELYSQPTISGSSTVDLEEEKERLKKYMKMPQLIGEENVERLKKQKVELDKLRKEILEQEQVKAKL